VVKLILKPDSLYERGNFLVSDVHGNVRCWTLLAVARWFPRAAAGGGILGLHCKTSGDINGKGDDFVYYRCVDVSVKLGWMVSVAKGRRRGRGRERERLDIGIEKERVGLWVFLVSWKLPCCGLDKEGA
jgi:hypothetical protein